MGRGLPGAWELTTRAARLGPHLHRCQGGLPLGGTASLDGTRSLGGVRAIR